MRPDIELREWESLVFSNRLTSPFAADSKKLQANRAFIESAPKEIYSIEDRFESSIDYGLYFRDNKDSSQEYVITAQVDQFLTYLLDTHDLIVDPHEQYHAYHLLIRLSRTYFNYALQSEAKKDEISGQIAALQKIFPGRLVTLETMLRRNLVTSENRQTLLALAAQAERDIPVMVTNKSLAVFYEYYGRILMKEDADAGRALAYFERSIAIYPASENTSICPHRRIAKTYGFEPVHEFKDVACP